MTSKAIQIQDAIRKLDWTKEHDRKKFNDAVEVMGKGNLKLTNFLLLVDPNVGMEPEMRAAFEIIRMEQEERDKEILDILES